MNDPTLPSPNPTNNADLPTVAAANRFDTTTLPPRLDGTTPISAPTARNGTSRYGIVRLLARGGLGEVFLARDGELEREVALKEIQSPFADDVDSRTRFVREGKVTGGLEHPGIVPVYGLGTYADGRPYYAMRFIKGESLHDASARFHQADTASRDPGERTLALRQLLRRFIDVCNAIEYAHSRGVLHRDLKPANVMLGSYGETLVVDWGLARAFGQDEENPDTENVRPSAPSGSGEAVTRIGSVIGTPEYMSPEQAAGKSEELGPASDIYSLGATLYCLLTGKSPIDDPDVLLTLVRVQTGEFAPPRRVKPGVPAALEAICLKAMALHAEARYASARELADDLEHWLADEAVTAHRESLWERALRFCRHRPMYAGVMGFLAAMDLAIGAAFVGIYFGTQALAFLPFMIFGGVIGAGISILMLAQAWWLVGALAGALLARRGTKSGGLIGLVSGGSLAWTALALSQAHSPEVILMPLAGVVPGILLGVLGFPRWTGRKKPTLLLTLLGIALGFLVGSLIAAIALGEEVSFDPVLSGTIVGALIGVALGLIGGAFRGHVRRTAVAVATGALLGTPLAFLILIFVHNGNVSRLDTLTALLGGGLPGAALGAFVAGCRGEVKKRVVWSVFLGGRLGIALGAVAFTLLATITFALQVSHVPYTLAITLPAGLVPLFLDVGVGWRLRASWDRLLTHGVRGSMIGALLGLTAAVSFMMSGFPAATSNSAPGTESAKPPLAGRVPAFAPLGILGGAQDPFQQVIASQEAQLRNNPNNVEAAVILGTLYSGQAGMARTEKNPNKALPLDDKAIATLQAALQKNPRHPTARQGLRDSHSGRAETLIALNRPGEALAEWDRALEVDTWPQRNEFRLQRALALAWVGEHVQATKEGNELAKGKDLAPATLYTLARIYARSASAVPAGEERERFAGRALALLAEAEAAGCFQAPLPRGELKTSEDFNTLRSRPEFQKLLARQPPG